MIIQTGMRTDIPAFYSEWFVNRIKEGFVLVRNPYNPSQVSRYSLSAAAYGHIKRVWSVLVCDDHAIRE